MLRKNILAVALLLLPCLASAQSFFIQTNGGIVFPIIHKSQLIDAFDTHGKKAFTGSIQAGIGNDYLEGGIRYTGQRLREEIDFTMLNGAGFARSATAHMDYGKTLMTGEGFFNLKLDAAPLTIYVGVLGGVAHTTGDLKFPGVLVSAKGAGDNGTYGGYTGWVAGFQLGLSAPLAPGLSVHAAAAYKYVSFNGDFQAQPSMLLGNEFRLSLIPVTAGLRYTF